MPPNCWFLRNAYIQTQSLPSKLGTPHKYLSVSLLTYNWDSALPIRCKPQLGQWTRLCTHYCLSSRVSYLPPALFATLFLLYKLPQLPLSKWRSDSQLWYTVSYTAFPYLNYSVAPTAAVKIAALTCRSSLQVPGNHDHSCTTAYCKMVCFNHSSKQGSCQTS